MATVKCKHCGKSFTPKNERAAFCSDACRVNMYNKKKRLEKKLAPLEKSVSDLDEQISIVDIGIDFHECEIARLERELIAINKKLKPPQKSGWATSVNKGLAKKPPKKHYNGDIDWGKVIGYTAGALVVGGLRYLAYNKFLRPKNQQLPRYTAIPEELPNSPVPKPPTLQGQAEALKARLTVEKGSLEQARQDKAQLERQRKALVLEIDVLKRGFNAKLQAKGIHENFLQHEVVDSKGIGAGDILHMQFETFNLPNRVGRFFGNLDRNMLAIALTGDPGAGKSTFSIEIAQAFDQADFSVAYFSLEMGIGSVFQQGVKRYPLSNRVQVFEHGGMTDVERAAKKFDVVSIDSFGKTGGKQEDIDRLRKAHPNTILVFIFQKTTKGTTRGGASVDFDCTMVIDVVKRDGKRIAIMKKSRYGTQGEELVLG